jgi:hypothetical protein
MGTVALTLKKQFLLIQFSINNSKNNKILFLIETFNKINFMSAITKSNIPIGPGRVDQAACHGAVLRPDERAEHPQHDEGVVDILGAVRRRIQGALLQRDGARRRAVRSLQQVASGHTLQGLPEGNRLTLYLVWCTGQNKRKAPLPFFRGCRKRRLKD